MDSYRGRSLYTRLPGERSLWAGKPGGGLVFSAWDIFLIPFSLLWCGFAIFWEVGALTMGGPDFFALWGIPFVLIGLYFVFGRFLVDMWLRRKTTYELTSHRIIIERTGLFANTTTMMISDLPPMSLTERASGRGTIRFGKGDFTYRLMTNGMDLWSPAMSREPQFLNIDRATDVFHMIQRQQAEYWEQRR